MLSTVSERARQNGLKPNTVTYRLRRGWTADEAYRPRLGFSSLRPARVVGDVAYITLSNGGEALLDACDVALLSGHAFCRDSGGYPASCAGRMHQLILGRGAGSIDHIDGNKLNNRRSNLRRVSQSQNAFNCGMRSTNTSGHRGVGWCVSTQSWRAYIGVRGCYYHLGVFMDYQQAVQARLDAEVRFGLAAFVPKAAAKEATHEG